MRDGIVYNVRITGLLESLRGGYAVTPHSGEWPEGPTRSQSARPEVYTHPELTSILEFAIISRFLSILFTAQAQDFPSLALGLP